MPRLASPITTIATLSLLAACRPTTDTVQVTDLALRPISVLDGASADLVPIGWLAASRVRTVGAAQAQDGFALLLDSLLRVSGHLGRSGEGPGEFRELSLGAWLGDSLWIYDGNLRRFTIGSAGGAYGRSFPAPVIDTTRSTQGAFPQVGFYSPVGLLPGDTIVAVAPPSGDGFARGLDGRRATFFLAERDGTPTRAIGQLAEDRGRVPIVAEGFSPGSVMRTPFHPVPLWAVSAEARRVALAETHFADEAAGEYSVVMLGFQGDTLYTRSFAFRSRPIPSAAMDSALARLFPPTYPGAASLRAQLQLPRSYPPLVALRVGRDGSAWIGLYPDSSSRTWLVLDPAGDIVGRVRFPRNESLRDATLRDAWVTQRRNDGIETIVRYHIGTGQ